MSSANHTSVASGRGGRASALGPRRALFATIAAAILAVVLGLWLSGVLSSGGTAGAHRSSVARFTAAGGRVSRLVATNGSRSGSAVAATSAHDSAKYGGLPNWLPKPKVHVNRVLTATTAHPALSIQGDTVAVDLPHGRVLATAVGPEVPEEGRFPVPATTPCTFIVTFASASGMVPLNPAAFTFLDDQGHTHHPQMTAMDGGPPPTMVAPGKTVSLKLYDVLPTGDGGLAWAPTGGRMFVGWDYTVEID
jgi:hypothetical protein